MARLVFNAGDVFTIGGSNTVTEVFGSSGKDTITIAAGAKATLFGFDSTDAVSLGGNAGSYTVVRSGSSIVLTDAAGSSVTIPVSDKAQSIAFGDATRSLVYNTTTGNVELGTQAITTTAATVTAGTGGSSVAGQTFTLTTGTDTVAGTAGDDTINATVATLNALDVVNGGAGTDTLSVVDTAAVANLGSATISGIETLSIKSGGAIGAIAATAVTNQAAQAQVATITLNSATTATYAAADVLTVTIGNAVYTSAVGSSGGANQAALVIRDILRAHLGDDVSGTAGTLEGLVDIEVSSNVVTITSKKAGTALPSFTVATNGTDADDTFTVSASATANKVATGPGAIKEVLTISVDAVAGTTTTASENLAVGETIRVSVGGVDYAIASTGTSTSTAATDIAAALNTALGAGSAVATGNIVTVTAATAGTALPYIDVGVAGATAFAESYTVTVANQVANTAAASNAAVAAPSGVTSYTAAATGVASVSAATTSTITASGTAVRTSGGSDVKVTASDSVHVTGAKGSVTISTGKSDTTMLAAVAADNGTDAAGNATGVYVQGGTSVTITGTKDTAAVKVGAAPYAVGSVNTTGNLPELNGNASVTPTGDVSITRVTASASASTGLVSSTWSTATAKVYMNGGTTATVRGAGNTDIVDVNTFALLNASGVSTIGTSTLSTVNLSGLASSAVANITSDAISTVSVTNSRAAATINVLASAAPGANSGPINYVLSNVGTEGVSPTRVTLVDNTTGAVNISSGSASTYTGSANVGSASFVTISSTKATAINLTNSLAVDLGAVLTNAPKLSVVNGSAATGAISLTVGATPEQGLNVTTGSGNDSVTLTSAGIAANATTAAITAINLGAGNDRLLSSHTAPVTITGATINGGDGIDTVAASLLNAGNAAQFVNFEVLGLDLASGSFDTTLLSGATGLALLKSGTSSTTVTYSGVKASQGLTVGSSVTAGAITALGFEAAVLAGTADSYTVTFAGVGTTNAVATKTVVEAGILSLTGIETVNIVSGGTGFTNNTVALRDASATSLIIGGNQYATVTFDTAFGTASSSTNGLGVSLVDASSNTAGVDITIGSASVFESAYSSLTIKGSSAADKITLAASDALAISVDAGAGNDNIITAAGKSFTLTGGAGTDTFDVSATVYGNTTGHVVTIADLTAGETIKLATASGTTTFTTTKVDVSAATTLAAALDLAAATNVTTNDAAVKWFQYGGNTFLVQDLSSATTFAATDLVVRLNGLLDLSNSAVSATEIFTFG